MNKIHTEVNNCKALLYYRPHLNRNCRSEYYHECSVLLLRVTVTTTGMIVHNHNEQFFYRAACNADAV